MTFQSSYVFDKKRANGKCSNGFSHRNCREINSLKILKSSTAIDNRKKSIQTYERKKQEKKLIVDSPSIFMRCKKKWNGTKKSCFEKKSETTREEIFFLCFSWFVLLALKINAHEQNYCDGEEKRSNYIWFEKEENDQTNMTVRNSLLIVVFSFEYWDELEYFSTFLNTWACVNRKRECWRTRKWRKQRKEQIAKYNNIVVIVVGIDEKFFIELKETMASKQQSLRNNFVWYGTHPIRASADERNQCHSLQLTNRNGHTMTTSQSFGGFSGGKFDEEDSETDVNQEKKIFFFFLNFKIILRRFFFKVFEDAKDHFDDDNISIHSHRFVAPFTSVVCFSTEKWSIFRMFKEPKAIDWARAFQECDQINKLVFENHMQQALAMVDALFSWKTFYFNRKIFTLVF